MSSVHNSSAKMSSLKNRPTTKCILCVDPPSKKFYLSEIHTGKIAVIKKIPEDLERRVKKEIDDLEYLSKEMNPVKYNLAADNDNIILDSKDVYYEYEKNHLDYYKRRKIPEYLISLDRTDYSRYASKDDISIAYLVKGMESVEKDQSQVTTEIETVVHLVNYTDLLNTQNNQPGFNGEQNVMRNKSSRFQGGRNKKGLNEYKVEINLTLINSVNECVKKIIREACFKYGVVIQKKDPNKVWGLKMFDFDEYLYGDIPLINYYSVQRLIRNYSSLEIVVVEIPRNASQYEFFPPLYNFPKDVSIKQIEKRIDWDQIRNSPLYFWYAPRDLLKFEKEDKHQRNSAIQKDLASKPDNVTQFGFKKQILSNLGAKHTFLRPRALIYNTILQFNEERYKAIKNKRRPLRFDKVYSGECDFTFRLKIVGAENLQEIFRHYQNECYYNGKQVPNYVSHHPKKKDFENSSNRMGDKFNKIGKDIRQVKTQKISKKEVNKEQPEEQPGVDENQQKNTASISSINVHLFKLPFLNHTPKKRDSHLYPLIQDLGLPQSPYLIIPSVYLLLGNRLLHEKVEIPPQPFNMNPRFDEMIRFGNIRISQLPLETRVGINLTVVGGKGDMMVIGCAQTNLFDKEGKLVQGQVELSVWPFYQLDPRIVSMGEYPCRVIKEPPDAKKGIPELPKCTLTLQFDSFAAPMYYSVRDPLIMKELGFEERLSTEFDYGETADSNDLVQVNKILSRDPTNLNLTQPERNILIKARNHLKFLPSSLSVFLMAINWLDPEQVLIVLKELHEWKSPENLEEFIPLLDVRFHNEYVRSYAVQNLSKLTDKDIELYILNFTMALAYEPEAYNPLTEFLLERSAKNYAVVGTRFYWMMRSWLHWKVTHIRYSTILEQFLMVVGSGRDKLVAQIKITEKMKDLTRECQKNAQIKKNGKVEELIQKYFGNGDEKRAAQQARDGMDAHMMNESKMNKKGDRGEPKQVYEVTDMPEVFTFPHDARLKSSGVSPSECKVFSSKKAPILISTLNNEASAPNFEVLFKMGDDLKQDILTLQILRLFDKWWLEAGLDLKMSPYQVTNTQDLIGYIEFVQNSDTMKEIFDKFGGTLSTFDKYIITKYLENNNRGVQYEIAVENFRRSVAGYCLLTYVMGVGDRHISNYMVNKDGKFFHIDFGHILGHFKQKFFFNRERSKVAFTKEMMHAIGKDHEEYFYKLCFFGMSILRKKSHLLLNLLQMLLSADMPHLKTKNNLNWVKEALHLTGNDTEASEKFKKVLEEGYNDTYRRFDNWFHRLRHGDGKKKK